MIFNKHLGYEGKHAFLGASKYYWLNYTPDRLKESYYNSLAVQRGTELHDFAKRCIQLNQKLPRSKKTLNSYVNDAIGYRMTPEQILYYSDNCFGTADAISFFNNQLRIHDLKTGMTQAHMEQLMIYASLFCLEYDVSPMDILIELRIYQNDEINIYQPPGEEVVDVMGKIIEFDELIDIFKEGESEL